MRPLQCIGRRKTPLGFAPVFLSSNAICAGITPHPVHQAPHTIMAKDFTRSDRVAQQMQRELAELIRLELKDPRIGMVTLTDVEVTRDMSHAKVFFTLLSGDPTESLYTLNRSAGWLRSEVSKRIKLFKMPELHFVYDTSVEYGMSLDKLIDEAMQTTKPADDEADADKKD